jgi:L-ascorbate metabolism protein UlaG (beta-lactamase superfamily)
MGRRLVMTAEDAIAGARVLGADTLVPIHYALRSVPLLLQTPGSVKQLHELALGISDPKIVVLEPGQRWSWSRRPKARGGPRECA